LQYISTAPNKTEVILNIISLLTIHSPEIWRYLTVLVSLRCGMQIQKSQRVYGQRALAQLSVLVMQPTGRTGWEICKKGNGTFYFIIIFVPQLVSHTQI
jgi:hypothetical protein